MEIDENLDGHDESSKEGLDKLEFNKMGRPKKEIDLEQLQLLMRLNPTLEETAAFFMCGNSTVERRIKENFNQTFDEFRQANMAFTRLLLRRKAIRKAEQGDNQMLVWCQKNVDNWTDKVQQTQDKPININLQYNLDDEDEKAG